MDLIPFRTRTWIPCHETCFSAIPIEEIFSFVEGLERRLRCRKFAHPCPLPAPHAPPPPNREGFPPLSLSSFSAFPTGLVFFETKDSTSHPQFFFLTLEIPFAPFDFFFLGLFKFLLLFDRSFEPLFFVFSVFIPRVCPLALPYISFDFTSRPPLYPFRRRKNALSPAPRTCRPKTRVVTPDLSAPSRNFPTLFRTDLACVPASNSKKSLQPPPIPDLDQPAICAGISSTRRSFPRLFQTQAQNFLFLLAPHTRAGPHLPPPPPHVLSG